MAISIGGRLPGATLLASGPDGIHEVDLGAKLKGRKVVIFGLPGAFTGTCSTMHVPSFIRTKAGFDAKGVDEIICIAVNDPFVTGAWENVTGARKAGITTLADAAGEFTRAVEMEFTFAPKGLHNRSKRYSLYAEDGVVKVFNPEPPGGECEISAGETLLAAL